MQREDYLHELLNATYESEQVDIYHFSHQWLGEHQPLFANTRVWAHYLVKEKLCYYTDEEKTQLQITNYGRYWMLHDGYRGFLKDEHVMKDKELREKELEKAQQKDVLLEARLKLTHYRLIGFWVALLIAVIGLVVSGFNLYLFLKK
ncbi:MAG TPA: hypothetical protein VLC98_12580 [Phnomibacter sp.]|nr:hypothetical protein [Phnomibacter sp.]